jgi:hypothetical protein
MCTPLEGREEEGERRRGEKGGEKRGEKGRG